jgi:predicted ATPase
VLNGNDVSLGTSDEVVDKVTGRDSFLIGLLANGLNLRWTFGVDKDDGMVARVIAVDMKTGGVSAFPDGIGSLFRLIPSSVGVRREPTASTFEPLQETLLTLSYISADRVGPRETYPASSNTQQNGVGARGEYTPWVIQSLADLEIPTAMCFPDVPPTLLRQVEGWLAHFFPGSGLEIERIPRTGLLTMRLRTSQATNYHRPANVGYGLSHVLPVIAAALSAVGLAQREKRVAPLVLVENPELHLHPAGQSAMGVFLARAAASGAQVIIETHSDHVLNGIRLAVKGIEGEPVLRPDQVAIHFFQPRDDAGMLPQLISPRIDRSGNLDVWPTGFFDQFDKDTSTLIDW